MRVWSKPIDLEEYIARSDAAVERGDAMPGEASGMADRLRAVPSGIMTTYLTRADLDANESWVSCGQTAVAALLRRPLADMRAVFPPHPRCNLRDMRAALSKLDARWKPTLADPEGVAMPGRESPAKWPSGWMPRSWWANSILPEVIAGYKRATGGWWVRAGLEVST